MRIDQKFPKGGALAIAIIFWVAFIILLVSSGHLAFLFPGPWPGLLCGIFGTCIAFLLVRLFLRIERKSFRDIGLIWQSSTFSRFIIGVLIGAILFTLLVLPLLGFTSLHFIKSNSGFNFWACTSYLALIPLALMEEVGFRSYAFLKLDKAFGLRTTQIIVAFAFALYHVANGWSLYTAFTSTLVWAFVFGLAAARSGGIAMPTGLHFSVNALQMLVGMSGGSASLWKINFPPNTLQTMIDRTRSVQLGSAAMMLLLTILCTEYLFERNRARQS